MRKNRLVMILVVLVILVVGGFTLIATNDQGINDASANESLELNESTSGGLGFFNFGQKQRKPVEVDADGATETLDNIARDSADIKSRFRGVEENAAASIRRFEQTDALIKQLTAQNKLLENQINYPSTSLYVDHQTCVHHFRIIDYPNMSCWILQCVLVICSIVGSNCFIGKSLENEMNDEMMLCFSHHKLNTFDSIRQL